MSSSNGNVQYVEKHSPSHKNTAKEYEDSDVTSNTALDFLLSIHRADGDNTVLGRNGESSRVHKLIKKYSNEDEVSALSDLISTKVGFGKLKFSIEFANEKPIYVDAKLLSNGLDITMRVRPGSFHRKLRRKRKSIEQMISMRQKTHVSVSIESSKK